jgi:adenosine kinase
MSAVICGSFAFDTIMVFQDHFKNHILPDRVHALSVAFLVPELRREFGGCAGNIAYNLSMLGGAALPMGTVGKDFAPYAQWMDDKGISRKHVTTIDAEFTAQAFITTDLDDNQITAFHPGAMNFAHLNSIDDVEGASIGIVAPDGRDGMVEHARQFANLDIPFIFDPGQGLPMFDGDDLVQFLDQATWLAVNDYEWAMLLEKTGRSEQSLASMVDAAVITRGGDGSTILTNGAQMEIPPVSAANVADPTGCGDAYRAGLLYGLSNGVDWETTGRIASLIGALKIEHHGTQNHEFDPAQIETRFKESFGYAMS